MRVTVNGEERELDEGLSVAGLLAVMNVPNSGTAVARNDRVVKHSEQLGVLVEAGDRIEIIRAVAGG